MIMQITSASFILFAAVLLILYYLVPGKFQWILLLAASWGFYCMAGLEYVVFLVFTILTTYWATCSIDRRLIQQEQVLKEKKEQWTKEERKQYKESVKQGNRRRMILCLVMNFTVLGVCKALLLKPVAEALREGRVEFLTVALPLGISFYMFQSMGYMIDVYRGKVRAERNIFRLSLFASFFPQLIQGPISKYSQLAPQLYEVHRYHGKQVFFGIQRMLWGYFKKLVIADRIAAAVVALKGPEYTGMSFLMLTILYAVQIYGDFTGGIDVTVGLSQAMGIMLPENFVRPYFSKNIAEYWRRWHITLGEWMKDYIFYPISISKPMLKLSKKARQKLGDIGKRMPVYVASVATWFVTGIWHGLTPNFVLWGMLNCFVIVVSEELSPLYAKFHNRFHLKEKTWYGGFEILRMFMLMNLIRACDLFPDVGTYFSKIGSLFTAPNLQMLWNGTLLQIGLTGLDWGILIVSVVVVFAVSVVQEKKGSVRELLWRHSGLCAVAMLMLLVAVLLLGNYGIGFQASNFIYNQF